MTRWSESLPAELVLSQAEIGVIVADRTGNVVFSNEYVARMLRLDFATAPLLGKPLSGLGLLPEGEPGRVEEITRQVLSGGRLGGHVRRPPQRRQLPVRQGTRGAAPFPFR